MIRIIGLGSCDGDVSLKGAAYIDSAETVIVRTAKSETYALFDEIPHMTCDSVFDESEDFDALNENLARFVIEHEKGDTVYCICGSGFDDRSAIILKQLKPDIEIIAACGSDSRALSICPTTAFTSVSAYDVDVNLSVDTTRCTLVVKDIDSDYIAGVVKEFIMKTYGDEYPITYFVRGNAMEMPAYELDRLKVYDNTSAVLVKPSALTEKTVYNYADLLEIMRYLRSSKGCEWDKAQTHESLRQNAVEEAFELVDAINHDDSDNIREESGDVILQGAFHTLIGEEEGEFEAQEVLSGLCRKLVTRHPHVFGSVKADTAEKALESWSEAKAKEKKAKTAEEKLFRIADALPGLMSAEKIQKIAAGEGLDFADIKDAEGKLKEEIDEFLSASPEKRENEAGDLLFSIVNILRLNGIKSELALHRSNEKFKNRIVYVLSEAKKRGLDTKNINADEFDEMWREAKARGF